MLPIQALNVPLAYANGPFYFKVYQKYGRWTCAFVVQWATVCRWAYEICKIKAKWRRIPYVTRKHHHHHRQHRAHSDFQQLLQSKRCKIVLNRMIVFFGNIGDESDTNTSDNDSDSGDSDDEVYTWLP